MMKKNLWVCVIVFAAAVQAFGQDLGLLQELKRHVAVLASDSLEGRGEGTDGIEKARRYIVAEFEKGGVKPFGAKFQYDFTFKVGEVLAHSQNIIGVIDGTDEVLKNEYIVVGAHYDHIGFDEEDGRKTIYNGADDNASGTASIIELAKMLNANRALLKRSVLIIAFGAEESGLIGSKHFFSDGLILPSKIKCMFSLDMVGMYSKNKGLDLVGIETLKHAKLIVAEAQKVAPITISNMSAKIENRTDTESFGQNCISATHVFTGTKSPYHKPEDDSDLLDYSAMVGVNEFMYQLTVNLASRDSVEPTVKFVHKVHRKGVFAVTPLARLGLGTSYHSYPEQFFKAKSIFAYNVGLAAQIKVSKHWALQPEVVYGSSGSRSASGEFRTQQIATPFHLLYGFNNGEPVNVYVLFGGFYKYLISGSDGGAKIDFSREYNRSQYGISYGLGMDVMRVQVNVVWQYSINRIYSNPAKEDIRETGLFLNVGYKF